MNPPIIEQIFFIYFFISLSFLSLSVIISKNIMHSTFFLLIFLLHVAALFLFLNAEFLMGIQIIVYVGGVLALFVFAIMVMNIKEEFRHKKFVKFAGAGLITGFLFFIGICLFIKGARTPQETLPPVDVNLIGRLLYSYYLLPFEILSLVLLVALVGGIIIAKKLPREER